MGPESQAPWRYLTIERRLFSLLPHRRWLEVSAALPPTPLRFGDHVIPPPPFSRWEKGEKNRLCRFMTLHLALNFCENVTLVTDQEVVAQGPDFLIGRIERPGR